MWDRLTFSQIEDEIFAQLSDDIIKFFPIYLLYLSKNREAKNVVPVNVVTDSDTVFFSDNPFGVYDNGSTIIALLIQIVSIMCCDPIYLLGVDHNYNNDGIGMHFNPNSDNHFIPDYNKDLLLYQYQASRAEAFFELACKKLSGMGRKIYNASPGTKLTVIPYIEFDDIFK